MVKGMYSPLLLFYSVPKDPLSPSIRCYEMEPSPTREVGSTKMPNTGMAVLAK